jgi:hypothetical protein
VADKWAAKSGSWGSRRPGFEDQLLYHVREAPRDIVLPESGVIVIEGPVASIGPQNERPGGVKGVRTSPEGKTTTTDFPGGDFPGESR